MVIKFKTFYNLWLFILLFLYTIGPILNTPLGAYLDSILLVSLLLILNSIIRRRPALLSKWGYTKFFYILQAFVLIVSLCHIIAGDNIPVNELIRPIRILITIYGGIELLRLYEENYKSSFYNELLLHVLIAMSLNAVFVLMQVSSPALLEASQQFFFRIEEVGTRYGDSFRIGGFLGAGGAATSMIQMISILAVVSLVKVQRINFITAIIIVLLFVFSSIFMGRSGLFMLAPLFLYIYFEMKHIQRFVYIPFLVFVVFVILINAESLLGNFEAEAMVYSINRLFALQDGAVEDTSNSILSQLRMPDTPVALFFGDVDSTNHRETIIMSDMGFSKSIWKYGILGTPLYYMFLFIIVAKLTLHKRKIDVYYWGVSFTILSYLVFELKEQVCYSRGLLSVLVLLYFGYCLYIKNKKNSVKR